MTTLAATDRIYQMAAACTATRELVDHQGVQEFVRRARLLLELVGAYPDDMLLRSAASLVRRARWDIHSLPLPLDNDLASLRLAADELEGKLGAIGDSFGPQLVATGAAVVQALRTLAVVTANPLGTRIAEVLLLGDIEQSVVLVRRREAVEPVSSWLAAQGAPVCVVCQEELPFLPPQETMAVCGPSRWFHRHVATVPRAEQMCFVHYSWLRDADRVEGFLDGASSVGVERKIRQARPSTPNTSELPAEEVAPSVDWARLAARAASSADADRVLANVFILAGGYRVFLEADEGPLIFILDPEAEMGMQVRRWPTRNVRPGHFIVLRSEQGDADYIRAVSDALLGERARALRADQARWKAALRTMVAARGTRRVEADLTRSGVQARNVRYWMSPDSIRTQRQNDFILLMDYIGLGGEAATLWARMGELQSAHQEAGREVRAQLEERIADINPRLLARDGHCRVELDVEGAGSLGIFRVEHQSPEPIEAAVSVLRWPERIQGATWPG